MGKWTERGEEEGVTQGARWAGGFLLLLDSTFWTRFSGKMDRLQHRPLRELYDIFRSFCSCACDMLIVTSKCDDGESFDVGKELLPASLYLRHALFKRDDRGR